MPDSTDKANALTGELSRVVLRIPKVRAQHRVEVQGGALGTRYVFRPRIPIA